MNKNLGKILESSMLNAVERKKWTDRDGCEHSETTIKPSMKGAVKGAAVGAVVAGPVGAVIGGAIGGIFGEAD